MGCLEHGQLVRCGMEARDWRRENEATGNTFLPILVSLGELIYVETMADSALRARSTVQLDRV